jgi:predicted cobalt transporter CbtA
MALVSHALLLGAASTLRGGLSSWRQGLCWGLAGYSMFFIAQQNKIIKA